MFMDNITLIKATKGLDGIMVLRELYEECYGIAKHITSKNPLELVKLQPKESLEKDRRSMSHIERYVSYGIYELYGIPYDRFITLPIHLTSELLDVAKRKRDNELKKSEQLQEEADKLNT